MIGCCVATLPPLGGWSEQEDTFRRPSSDTHRFEVRIITSHCLRVKCEQGLFLLFEDLAFSDTGCLDLCEFRKPRAITGQMQTVAVDPAMIGAFAPTGLLIQVAQFFGNPTCQSVGLMPNRSMGFEQTGVFNQNMTIELWMQGFCPAAHK